MAFEAQRFIHAANIRLDVPVSVQTTEKLTDELRFAFEDATLHAFEEVIDSCLRRNVDFLLLSGNVFIEADRSLRARLALLKGFRRLQERNIHVFVLPGDTDPPEAWRSVPELPENVSICYSSSPEPMELYVEDRLTTTVSASMWFGDTDDFGIQVIAQSDGEIQPFRIGVISRAKYDESLKMAAMAASASDNALADMIPNAAVGEQIDSPGSNTGESDGSSRVWRSVDADPGETPRLHPEKSRRSTRSPESLESENSDSAIPLDPHFLRYVDEMLHEGRLNYLAFIGEMNRTTLWRDSGVVHCPGTTQTRSRSEGSTGSCSLVEVSAAGEVNITSLDTSCVDWKQIEISVPSGTTLTSMLQEMKTRLLAIRPGNADRYWSVTWILRGALPVLRELARSDLDVAAAVELDELRQGNSTIRLLHEIRSFPDAWPSADPPVLLAEQYQELVHRPRLLQEASLLAMINGCEHLTTGWKQRLMSLLPSIDPEQIMARLRMDGASWFEPEFPIDDEQSGAETDAESEDVSDDEMLTDASQMTDAADKTENGPGKSGRRVSRPRGSREAAESEDEFPDGEDPDGEEETDDE